MRNPSSNYFERFIYWISTIGIAFGVMVLIIVLSIMNGFENKLENSILKFIPQALITNQTRCIDPDLVPLSITNTLKGVMQVAPLTIGNVVLQSKYNIAVGVMLGVNPNYYEPILNDALLGTKMNSLVAGKYRIILGNKLAIRLGVQPGDYLRLVISGVCHFTPIGCFPSQRLFLIVDTFCTNSEVDNYQLLVHQQDASRMMYYPSGCITGWRLWLKKPLALNQIIDQKLSSDLIWHDWRESKGELFHAIYMEKYMMSILLSLIIIVAISNIFTSIYLLVMKKKADIAILQTQGLSRREIILIFFIQGAISGIIGSLIGTVLGVLFAKQLKNLNFIINILLPIKIDPIQVTIIVLLTILLSLLSTIYPSWCAANICPAKVLRHV